LPARRVDKEGITYADAAKSHGIDVFKAMQATAEQKGVLAYLELHIEQGPVLESLGLPPGAVLGTVGVERNLITFKGHAAHSGSTPMNVRRTRSAPRARWPRRSTPSPNATRGSVRSAAARRSRES
jgi:hypothetical protein